MAQNQNQPSISAQPLRSLRLAVSLFSKQLNRGDAEKIECDFYFVTLDQRMGRPRMYLLKIDTAWHQKAVDSVQVLSVEKADLDLASTVSRLKDLHLSAE